MSMQYFMTSCYSNLKGRKQKISPKTFGLTYMIYEDVFKEVKDETNRFENESVS